MMPYLPSIMRPHGWVVLFICLITPVVRAQKGQWVAISEGVTSQLEKEGKKIGYPGLTAGITVDPGNGDVYMVVCDQGLWKSTDRGQSFARIDKNTIGGRCETGFALNFDPAGKRLACFMIYGACARTEDSGARGFPGKPITSTLAQLIGRSLERRSWPSGMKPAA